MAAGLTCAVCDTTFDGRSDRRWCSKPCQKALKTVYDKAYHVENRETKIERACEWQRQNKERKQRYDRERRETLPKRKRRYKANRAARRQISAKRRAAKLNQGAFKVSPRDLRRALNRSRNRCAYCEGHFTDENPLEWDHVHPIARGGSHSIGNLLPSCKDCNRNKHVKFISEWTHGRIVCVRDLKQYSS